MAPMDAGIQILVLQKKMVLIILLVQCFDAVGWAAGRASGLEKNELWGAGVVICLERAADLPFLPVKAKSLISLIDATA